MAIEFASIDVTTAEGVALRHTLSYHNNPISNRLLVLLPGRFYFTSSPALYYLGRAGLSAGYDLLPVTFGFQAAPERIDGTGDLLGEARAAVSRALERGYGQVCLAGKSLGSPVAAALAQELAAKQVSLILLTPVAGAASFVGDVRTLAVIGTADPMYDAQAIADETRANITWRVFDGLDHGFDKEGDWRGSIAALADITAACDDFLRGEGAAFRG
jgi:hypothetical protein